MKVEVVKGDITRINVDAVVNAANPSLLGGGGVDGAIHKAAGPRLLKACKKLSKENGIRCPPGYARPTEAYDLDPNGMIIHAVGPRYTDYTPEQAEELLAQTFWNCMVIAVQHKVKSIAFPAISCGAYGFPIKKAALIAAKVILKQPAWNVGYVFFVLPDPECFEAFDRAFQILDHNSDFNQWRESR